MTITNCIVIPHENRTSTVCTYSTTLLAIMTNCCQAFNRGLLLLLAWNMLLRFSSDFIIFKLLPSTLSPILNWLSYLFVLLPVVGWAGDSLLGRYRAIIAGFFLLTVAFLTYLSAFFMSQFSWTQIPAIIMLCVSQLMALFGLGSIYTNMLPFMIDQMIGATADDIGAAVQWNFWTFAVGSLTQNLICPLYRSYRTI